MFTNKPANETKPKSMKVNFLFLALYKALLVLTPLIIAPYTSRVLGVELVGDYSYYMSIIGYFTLIAGFGFSDYGSRVIARYRDDKHKYSVAFFSIFIAQLLLGIGLLIVFFTLNYTYVFGKSNTLIFSILSMQIIAVFIDPFFLFTGLEKFKQITTRTLIIKLVLIVCIFVFVRDPSDFINYVIIYSVVVIGSPILMFFYLPKLLDFKVKINELNILEEYKKSFTYFIPVISVSLYALLGKSMIRWITNSSSENGYFEQATKITNLMINTLAALNVLMLSRLSYLYEIKDEKQIEDKRRKGFKTLFLLSIPLVFGLILLNPYFTTAYFGSDFKGTINVLYILAPIIFFASLRMIIQSVYFVPKNKLKIYDLILLSGTLFNVLLNLVTIFYLGAIGAAISTSVTELLMLVVILIYIRKEISLKYLFKCSYKQLIGAIIMLGIGYLSTYLLSLALDGVRYSSIIICIIVFIICVIIYFLILVLLKEEMAMLTINSLKNKIIKKGNTK